MSFSVCVICCEHPAIVSRFVAYYLSQGAEHVAVYLDEGAPDPALPADRRVTVVAFAELLASSGLSKRPKYIEELQVIAYDHAFAAFPSEWLLICDIDEFVGGSGTIAEAVSYLPKEWHYAILPVAEAVWGPDDRKFADFGCTYFRTRTHKGFGRAQSRLLYGRSGQFLVAGLVGHCLGKYFVRKGAPVTSFGIHEPQGDATLKGGAIRDVEAASAMFLYHFDAISFERWQQKWLGRIEKNRASNAFDFNKATALYAQQFERAKDRAARMQLFSSLYEINEWQAVFLKAVGQLRRKKLWID